MANHLNNWCGEYSSQESRRLFSEAGSYRTPEGRNHGVCIWWNIAVTKNN